MTHVPYQENHRTDLEEQLSNATLGTMPGKFSPARDGAEKISTIRKGEFGDCVFIF